MLSPYIRSLVKLSGEPEEKIEKLWKEAKKISMDTFGKKEEEFEDKEYSYTIGIVKQMLGIKEEILDPSKFLESDLSASDYLETVTSGGFPSLNKNIVNKNGGPEKSDLDVVEIQKDDDLEKKKKKAKPEEDPKEKVKKSESFIKEELAKIGDDIDWGKALDQMIEQNQD